MNAIQIVRETEQFPEMERISENLVNFYFDHSERPYGEGTQYMAVAVDVDYPEEEGKEDDIDEVKALAMPAVKDYLPAVCGIHAAKDIQQGRFAGAARTDDHAEFTLPDFKCHVIKRRDALCIAAVVFADAVKCDIGTHIFHRSYRKISTFSLP